MGTGYALFSEQLSINTLVQNVAYSQSDDLFFQYSWSTTQQGGNWLYSYNPALVENNGTTAVNDWSVVVSIPSDASSLTCQATVSCSRSGTTLTIIPQLSIATIAAGSSVNFTFSYVTSNPKYTLDNVSVSASPNPTFQTLSGLTVSVSQGARQKSGNLFNWPFTFTVTNNSAQPLRAWRISTNWATGNRVVSMPANINYITTASQLIMTATEPLTIGGTYQYTAVLGPASGGSFSLTGVTVQGVQ